MSTIIQSATSLLYKVEISLLDFSEMKGDVGMSHHEKEGNKKMPIPRQEIIDNPIPTSLFILYAAGPLCVGTGGAILGHIGTLENVYR